MSSPFGIIRSLNSRIDELILEHTNMMVPEETALLEAPLKMNALSLVEFKAKIDLQRKFRLDQINELKKNRDELIMNMDKYISDLQAKAPAAHKKRYDKAWSLFVNNRFRGKKHDDYIQIGYSLYDDGYISNPKAKAMIAEGDWIFIGEYRAFKKGTLYEREGYYTGYSYKLLTAEYFRRYVWGKWLWNYETWRPPGDSTKMGRKLRIKQKSAPLFDSFRNMSSRSYKIGNNVNDRDELQALIHVIRRVYPSVNEYIGNEESYPMFVNFAENVAWPTADQADLAIKKWMGVGSKKYAEANIKVLKKYAQYNIKEDAKLDFTIALPIRNKYTYQGLVASMERVPQTTYGIAKPNPNFKIKEFIKYRYLNTVNKAGAAHPMAVQDSLVDKIIAESVAFAKSKNYSWQVEDTVASLRYGFNSLHRPATGSTLRKLYDDGKYRSFMAIKGLATPQYIPGMIRFNNWSEAAQPHVSKDTAINWYWPRPKPGHIYVQGFDFINPAQWDGAYIKSTPTQYSRELARRRWTKKFKPMTDFMTTVYEVVPMFQDAMNTAIAFNIAMGIGVFFGPAAGIAATYQVGADVTGLSDTEIGKILTKIAEVATIAMISEKALEDVIEKAITQELMNAVKREVGKETGLDQTIVGRVTLDLAAGTAYNMYYDETFKNALKEAAKKSWRIELARSNPYAAMLLAGVGEIEKNGWPDFDSLASPSEWFDSFSWESMGDEIKRIYKSIKGKDIAKLIGITLAVQYGYITNEQAALMVGQEVAVRQIDRFYSDEPIYGVKTKADIDYAANLAEMNRWKVGLKTVKAIVDGKTPTRDDILIITNNIAGPIYDKIKEIIPVKYEAEGWGIAMDIGLPNAPAWIGDITIPIPEWAKVKDGDIEWPIITKKQMEDNIGKKLDIDVELTREDIVDIIMSILPKNVPLIPVGKEPEYTFNTIDEFGKLVIRDPLRFPYNHPMLKYNLVNRTYTKKQKDYMFERNEEMFQATQKLKKIKEQLLAAGIDISQMG